MRPTIDELMYKSDFVGVSTVNVLFGLLIVCKHSTLERVVFQNFYLSRFCVQGLMYEKF